MSVVLKLGAAKKVGQPNYSSLDVSLGLEIESDIGILADEERLVNLIRQGYIRIFHGIEEQLKTRTVQGTYTPAYSNIASHEAILAENASVKGMNFADPTATALATENNASVPPASVANAWNAGTFGEAANVPDPVPGPAPMPSPHMMAKLQNSGIQAAAAPAPSFSSWCRDTCTQYGWTLSQLMPWLHQYFCPNQQRTNDNRAMGIEISRLGLTLEDWNKALEHLIESLEPQASA